MKETEEKRNALFSTLIYACIILLVFLINFSGKFKSGPCTPNLDVLSVLIIGPFSLIMILLNGVKTFLYKKPNKFSFFIHLLAFLIWIILLFVN